ncbi:uncharacterized protein LOC100384657 [Zea mays]|uniref:Uncharacterized protein n=1 Tax=Zea mays TaxID=4577 RepID=C4IZ69_MAIZE|nr:uncharacterized protein LOC100384657 [Zea mays]ACR34219.1 unknown [Zea mays]|eukprot:NP_001170613.1 uncharacterized protein LOC100384657 [Zea mays]
MAWTESTGVIFGFRAPDLKFQPRRAQVSPCARVLLFLSPLCSVSLTAPSLPPFWPRAPGRSGLQRRRPVPVPRSCSRPSSSRPCGPPVHALLSLSHLSPLCRRVSHGVRLSAGRQHAARPLSSLHAPSSSLGRRSAQSPSSPSKLPCRVPGSALRAVRAAPRAHPNQTVPPSARSLPCSSPARRRFTSARTLLPSSVLSISSSLCAPLFMAVVMLWRGNVVYVDSSPGREAVRAIVFARSRPRFTPRVVVCRILPQSVPSRLARP